MLVALTARDKPGHLSVRKANRDAHLAYLDKTNARMAGPFMDDAGAMTGSLVVIEASNRAGAAAWAANDPYAKAGLFETVRIEAWKKVIG